MRRGTEAIALEPAAAGAVKVLTTRGDFVAGQVVLAAGAWTPALARGLGLALPIEPAKGYSVDVDAPRRLPRAPALPRRRPLRAHAAGRRPAPGQHSGALRLGHDASAGSASPACARAAQRVIGMPDDGPVRQIWRGPRPVTPDGLPVVGRVPRRERVIVAAGHCMLGLSLGPVTGKLVAELAGGRAPSPRPRAALAGALRLSRPAPTGPAPPAAEPAPRPLALSAAGRASALTAC